MRHPLLAVTAVLALASGCYLGRTPVQKRNAKAINAVAIVAGGLITVATLAGALGGGTACNGDCNGGIGGIGGSSRGNSNTAYVLLGSQAVILTAIAMDIVMACVPTEPEPSTAPSTATRAPAKSTVTTPGLAPTNVTLR